MGQCSFILVKALSCDVDSALSMLSPRLAIYRHRLLWGTKNATRILHLKPHYRVVPLQRPYFNHMEVRAVNSGVKEA